VKSRSMESNDGGRATKMCATHPAPPSRLTLPREWREWRPPRGRSAGGRAAGARDAAGGRAAGARGASGQQKREKIKKCKRKYREG
jgi:predicted Zn-dependent protease